ncbi:hypothetical protein NDU88_003474 [Pleurodeles waltl]|uniref:Uncharacterized protein n=1 Tax=Pleurodeles waltl TaxID=8319 RepID=A0AAV7VFH1_PLEWA|nr:hypothetical protein NDU88_003474 [Pleurodeles waltl]
MRRSASSFPSAAAAASSLISPLRSSVLAEPGWPKRARTPGLSVCGVRSVTPPSVAAVWPQIQRLSAWVLVGGAGLIDHTGVRVGSPPRAEAIPQPEVRGAFLLGLEVLWNGRGEARLVLRQKGSIRGAGSGSEGPWQAAGRRGYRRTAGGNLREELSCFQSPLYDTRDSK